MLDDELKQSKEKAWLLISKIKEIIKKNKENIDFSQIREELISDDQLDEKIKEHISEEELERLVCQYDILLGNVYKKFLDKQKLENIILTYIKQEGPKTSTDKLEINRIKEKVREYVAELFTIYKGQKISQENLGQMLDNYNEVFDELYKRYVFLQKNVLTVLDLIKLNKNRDILDKEGMKQEIKESIQYKCSLYQDKLSKELRDLLKEYDLLFDWAYERYLLLGNQVVNQEERIGTSTRKEEVNQKKELQLWELEHKKAKIIDFNKAKKKIEVKNNRKGEEEEDLWQK